MDVVYAPYATFANPSKEHPLGNEATVEKNQLPDLLEILTKRQDPMFWITELF